MDKSFVTKLNSAEKGKTHMFFMGQAGFIVKTKNGSTLGIDLYLSDCVERIEPDHEGYKRLQKAPISADDLSLNILVATHPHYDHYDYDSMPKLVKPGTKLFASLECERLCRDQCIDQSSVSYVNPGDSFIENDITLHFINCDHGKGAPDAVGLIIETDGLRILFAGDTCLRLDRKDEYLKFGPIDIMAAPINGAYGNLNEEEHIALAKAIKPEISYPCHFGMFRAHGGSLEKFRALAEKENINYTCSEIGDEVKLYK